MDSTMFRGIPRLDSSGYHHYYSDFPFQLLGRGKGQSGVAILLSKSRFFSQPSYLTAMFPDWTCAEMEGRYLELWFENRIGGKNIFVCAYCPSASRNNDHRREYKNRFNAALLDRLSTLAKMENSALVFGGDLNVAQETIDIHPAAIEKISSGFRLEEREWLKKLKSILTDSFRKLHPTSQEYTTWYYLNRRGNIGMRYDLVCTSTENVTIQSARHALEYSASDHVPVTVSVLVPKIKNSIVSLHTLANAPVAHAFGKHKTVAQKIRPVKQTVPGGSIAHQFPSNMPPTRPDPAENRLTPERVAVFFKTSRSKYPGFVTEPEIEYLTRILLPRDKAFSFHLTEIGRLKPKFGGPFVINTVPHTPWYDRPSPIPPAIYHAVHSYYQERIDAGLHEFCSSPYSNRWWPLVKPNGTFRPIVDGQQMNRVSLRDGGTLPLIEYMTERIAGHVIYSGFDCHSYFDQIPISPESRDISAILTPNGQLRNTGHPQGWTNSMQNAQKVSNNTFVKSNEVEAYADDVTAFNESTNDMFELVEIPEIGAVRKFVIDHGKVISSLLDRVLDSGLTFSGSKVELGLPEILVTGIRCSKEGRFINPMASFFRLWISRYAGVAAPLYRLLRKNVEWEWEDEQITAFQNIKEALQSAPARRPLDYASFGSRPPILTTDSSEMAEAQFLSQLDESGREYISHCFSGLWNHYELQYHIVKKELISVAKEIRVKSDAGTIIRGMINNPAIHDKVAQRTIAYILQFPIVVENIGTKANPSDALTRMWDGAENPDDWNDSRELDDEIDRVFDLKITCLTAAVVAHTPVRSYAGSEFFDLARYLNSGELPEGISTAERTRFQRRASGYFLLDGVMFKRPKHANGIPLRVVTEAQQQLDLVEAAHKLAGGGHTEFDRTYLKIRIKYYWKGMQKMVRNYVNACEDCQRMRFRQFKEPAHLSKSPSTIFIVWYGDFIVMPWSSDQKRYLWHLQEALVGWSELAAFKTQSMEPAMNWTIKNVFYRYSFPVRMVFDQCSMSSEAAQEIYKKFGIHISIIAPHNHKGLGIVERAHAPIVGALARYSRGDPSKWPQKLDLATFADRISTNSSGLSPYNGLFGQQPLLHMDFIVESFGIVNFRDGMSTVELLAARMRQLERREDDLIEYKRRREAERKRGTDNYNKKNAHLFRDEPLFKGDKVLLFDSNQHDQFHRKVKDVWMGPYVIEDIRDGTYILRELNGRKRRRPETGDRLKRYIEPFAFGSNALFFDEVGVDWDLADEDHRLLKQLSESSSEDLFQRAFERPRWSTASETLSSSFTLATRGTESVSLNSHQEESGFVRATHLKLFPCGGVASVPPGGQRTVAPDPVS
ncbi:hypothetical protein CcCBS67573_g08985 [Chytriomyces confervae]|uniref:Integrase catalytic domain-containing protein n=1 Tax=Chytriomyces confervae TaxID=246404 RepID=A0A507EC53_9FUNG|nr:hypothetical protein CcCBS67573_g08985 [Chytriomyces confervae]